MDSVNLGDPARRQTLTHGQLALDDGHASLDDLSLAAEQLALQARPHLLLVLKVARQLCQVLCAHTAEKNIQNINAICSARMPHR